MSALLHPVGPEPERTYWLRRAAVLVALLVVVAVVISLVVNATGGRRQVSAVPPSPGPSAGEPSRSVAGSASTAATPSPSSPSQSTVPDPSEAEPKASAKPGAKTTAPTPAAVPLCAPAQLRATITGKRKLQPADDNTFELSLVNGSARSCRVLVSGANFELKIYSGTDRIWSSRDCDAAVKKLDKVLAEDRAVAWKMTWNGRRSVANCKNRDEIPQPGTYFATSQLTGAEPVQLRMILRN